MPRPDGEKVQARIRHHRRPSVVGLLILLLAGQLPAATPALAVTATFTVTSTADGGDTSIGDGACVTTAGACTLRAAVQEANALGGSVEVIMPAGTYPIAAEIAVTGDVTMVGAGSTLTHIRPAEASNFDAVFPLGQGASLAIHNAAYSDPFDVGAAWTEARGADASVALRDVSVANVSWTAFFAKEGASDRVTVEVVRSTFTDVEYPIFFDRGIEQVLDVRDSTFVRAGYSALFVDTRSGQFRIADSEITDTEGRAVEFYNVHRLPGDGQTTLEIVRSHVTGRGIWSAGGQDAGQPTLTTRVIDSELVGSGILSEHGALLIERTTFRDGGGLSHYDAPATIDASTFSNTSSGAVFGSNSHVDVLNSTFSGNGFAGLVLWDNSITGSIRNVTITGSYDDDVEAGGLVAYVPAVVIENSVISGNVHDCGPDLELSSGGHNVTGDGSCPFNHPTDLSGVDAQFGPLANHGGSTLTHEPLPGSPLIDAGSNATCPATDQRGVARPVDGIGDGIAVCDIGAVEVGEGIAPGDIEVRWEADSARRGLLRADGNFAVTLVGTPGGNATAHIDVGSWYTGGDSSQELLPAPADTKLEIALEETSAGQYTGQLPLWGVERVRQIKGIVAYGPTTVDRITTERLPVFVAGGLEINSDLDVAPWALPDARLLVRSAATTDGDTLALPVQGTVTTRWLRPADDYRLSVIDGQNRSMGEVDGTFQVRPGLRTSVQLALRPLPYIPFSVQLIDANGHPIPGLKAAITDDATGDQIAKAITTADGTLSAVARSPEISLSVDPLDLPYAPLERGSSLTALNENVELALGATLPTARVSGIVDHPDRPPVAGARVSLTSRIGERYFTTSTIAGEGGLYTAEVFQGEVTVQVDEPRAGSARVTADVTSDTTVNLMLAGRAIGTLEVQLLTRLAGEASATQVDPTSPSFWHYFIYASDASGRISNRILRAETDLPMRVGEPLRVCADGREAQLPKQCVDVLFDPDTLRATATMELEQAGRLEGTLGATPPVICDPGCGYRADIAVQLFKVDEDLLRLIRRLSPRPEAPPTPGQAFSAPFSIGVFEPGLYEVRLAVNHMVKTFDVCGGLPGCPPPPDFEWWGSESARVQVEVADDAVLALGHVPLSSCTTAGTVVGGCQAQFSTSAQSATSVSPTELLPGGTARLRTSAHNATLSGTPSPAENARLRLEIPQGSTLIPDSVTLDGQETEFTLNGGILEVQAGTITAGQQRVLQAWVRTDLDIEGDALWTQGTIVYGPDDVVESLGTGVSALRRLTMSVDSKTNRLEVSVSGRAFASSLVEVMVDGLVTASATASPGGYWSTTVTLLSTPLPRAFVFQARTESGDGLITSQAQRVTYDANVPVLRVVTVSQESSSKVAIDPAKGVARFPFVFVPSQPIRVDLEFDHPERVITPTVFVGGRSAPAVFDESDGLWRAVLRTTGSELGALSVGWNERSVRIDLAPTEPQAPLTVDEARASVGPPFNSFADLSVVADPGGTSVMIGATLPELDGVAFEVRMSSEPAVYEPTAEDLTVADQAGATIYDVRLAVVEGPDGVVLTTSGFIPDSALNQDATVSGDKLLLSMLNAAAASSTGGRTMDAPGPIGITTAAATNGVRIGFEVAFDGATKLTDISGMLVAGADYEELANLVSLMSTCSPARLALYQSRADRIGQDLVAFEVIKAAMAIAATVAAPASFGLGTLAIATVTTGLGYVWDKKNSARIADLRLDIQNDPECAPPVESSTSDSLPCNRQVWFDACDLLAEPTYIYDPSGFVFELFPEDRLDGVNATVQSATSPDGPWTIWDAEWFGQSNPQLTDRDGRYGWDVPEGWWRVRFDKVGYATAYSDVLQVLPPQFDVNVGMTRLTGPGIAQASGVADDAWIEVTFDAWMLPSWLTPETITLADGSGQAVSFTLNLPNLRTSSDHGEVARSVRLEIGRPLVDGESFTLTVDRVVQTYASIPADVDLTVDVTVVPRQPDPPDPGPCNGQDGVVLEARLVDGTTAVAAGGSYRWLAELTAIACGDVVDASAQGGAPAWSTTGASTNDGTVATRQNKKNSILAWEIGALGHGDRATLTLQIDGDLGLKAKCGSLLTIVSDWSVTATPKQPDGVPTKFMTAGPINATLIC